MSSPLPRVQAVNYKEKLMCHCVLFSCWTDMIVRLTEFVNLMLANKSAYKRVDCACFGLTGEGYYQLKLNLGSTCFRCLFFNSTMIKCKKNIVEVPCRTCPPGPFPFVSFPSLCPVDLRRTCLEEALFGTCAHICSRCKSRLLNPGGHLDTQ